MIDAGIVCQNIELIVDKDMQQKKEVHPDKHTYCIGKCFWDLFRVLNLFCCKNQLHFGHKMTIHLQHQLQGNLWDSTRFYD